MEQNKQLPKGWKEVPLKEVLDYEQPNNYIIKGKILDEETPIPVLTPNKSFIKGYTKEKEGIFNDLPVIIFDDFTADNKFVNFPFKVKSSAMKILKLKEKNASLKYLFYQIQTKKVNTTTHKRYYISVYSNLPFIFPIDKNNNLDLEEQQAIVSAIETQFTRLDESIKSLKTVKQKLEVYRKAVLKAAFKIEGEYKRIDTFCDIISGSTPKTDQKEYWDGNILWITPKDLSKYKNKYIENTSRKITGEGYKSCSATIIPENNVLMSSRAPIGYLVINKKPMCTNQGFKSFQIRNRKELNEEFLYYQLKQIVEKIKKSGSGTTFNEISKPKAASILIKVPKIDTQKQIVQSIEAKFSVIDKLEQVIDVSLDKTEKLRKSVLKSAFEGKLVNFKVVSSR